ncbi:MAG TPA: di-heme enzyme [Thiolinea sp.]|nr:di-heme enzyme [Thiolinea sp.]
MRAGIRGWYGLLLMVFGTGMSGCVEQDSFTEIDTGDVADRTFEWNIPARFPLPREPDANPVTEEKFQLGRHLFYDQRLSGNGTFACASCHRQSLAFTDGLSQSVGSTGQLHPRSAQALVNVAYNASVNWGNPSTVSLEQQTPIPLFAEFPVEMGLNDANRDAVLARLRAEPRYTTLFAAAFPQQVDPVSYDSIVLALATFGRGLNSFNSPYDQYEAGNEFAISTEAKRGMALFFDERTECFHCHGGMNFSISTFDRTQTFADTSFFNNGLYNLDDRGSYPEGGQGIYEITGRQGDQGRFRPPTLRNIALTAPYMHDGSIATLEDVLRHYMAGGRNITVGAHAGDGRNNPNKSGFVRPFALDEQEFSDLLTFLETLTDDSFINNPRFANPWEG